MRGQRQESFQACAPVAHLLLSEPPTTTFFNPHIISWPHYSLLNNVKVYMHERCKHRRRDSDEGCEDLNNRVSLSPSGHLFIISSSSSLMLICLSDRALSAAPALVPPHQLNSSALCDTVTLPLCSVCVYRRRKPPRSSVSLPYQRLFGRAYANARLQPREN